MRPDEEKGQAPHTEDAERVQRQLRKDGEDAAIERYVKDGRETKSRDS